MKINKFIAFFLLIIIFTFSCFNITAYGAVNMNEIKEKFEKKVYTKEYFNLNYRLYIPENIEYEQVPMIVFLHGAGERGDDNETQLVNAILEPFKNPESKFYDSVILAPQCPVYSRWVDYDWSLGNYSTDEVVETAELKMLAELIKETSENLNIDKLRIYIIGLSMGGYGAWDMLVRHADIFAAGVPICGGGDPSKGEFLSDMPIFTFHGSKDSVVSVENTREMVNAINSFNKGNIIYVEYEGMDHGIWNDAITYKGDKDIPSLEDWLFSKVKPLPENVELNKSSFSGSSGDKFKLEAKVTPSGTYITPSFSSSDTSVATVDEEGNVTLVGEGSTNIKVTAGDIVSVCRITVTSENDLKVNNEIKNSNNLIYYLIGGAVIVAAAAIILITIAKRKKKS